MPPGDANLKCWYVYLPAWKMIVAVLRRSLACTGHVELNRSEKCEYIIDNPEDSKEQTGTDSKTPIKLAKTCWRNIFVLENLNSGETPIYKSVFLNFRHKPKKKSEFCNIIKFYSVWELFGNYHKVFGQKIRLKLVLW